MGVIVKFKTLKIFYKKLSEQKHLWLLYRTLIIIATIIILKQVQNLILN